MRDVLGTLAIPDGQSPIVVTLGLGPPKKAPVLAMGVAVRHLLLPPAMSNWRVFAESLKLCATHQ